MKILVAVMYLPKGTKQISLNLGNSANEQLLSEGFQLSLFILLLVLHKGGKQLILLRAEGHCQAMGYPLSETQAEDTALVWNTLIVVEKERADKAGQSHGDSQPPAGMEYVLGPLIVHWTKPVSQC